MPYWIESLVQLYKYEKDALTECKKLNDSNTNPIEEDGYGPMSGCKYEVITLYVK